MILSQCENVFKLIFCKSIENQSGQSKVSIWIRSRNGLDSSILKVRFLFIWMDPDWNSLIFKLFTTNEIIIINIIFCTFCSFLSTFVFFEDLVLAKCNVKHIANEIWTSNYKYYTLHMRPTSPSPQEDLFISPSGSALRL